LKPEQQALVNEHIGLVRLHLRKRVPTPREPQRAREYEDLFQEGCVALVRAAARYNPRRHGPFAAYALPRIRGAVHAALTERFCTIHVPARARREAAQGGEPAKKPWPTVFDGLGETARLEQATAPDSSPRGETIRHTLRRRYEWAVQYALDELRSLPWRRRDPSAILARIAGERLLISSGCERTALRQIARDFDVSSGRVCAYEQKLVEQVQRRLASDRQAALLLELASQQPEGFDGGLDEGDRDRLLQAELDDFEQRFAQLALPARAELTYRLIERSASAIVEVVRNLYHLTLSETGEPRLA